VQVHAFIDESGDPGTTPDSSDYFVMSAVAVRTQNLARLDALLAELREATGRRPDHVLKFSKLAPHHRYMVTQILGRQRFVKAVSVVMGKRFFTSDFLRDSNVTYRYSLRFVLERLSWMAAESRAPLNYTVSHRRHMQVAQLRGYEQRLREDVNCRIDYEWVPGAGQIDRPQRVQALQLADIIASATALAFEERNGRAPDRNPCQNLVGMMYCRRGGSLASYGLKMFPDADMQKTHPWVGLLRAA
jgi:hypothetical protein